MSVVLRHRRLICRFYNFTHISAIITCSLKHEDIIIRTNIPEYSSLPYYSIYKTLQSILRSDETSFNIISLNPSLLGIDNKNLYRC